LPALAQTNVSVSIGQPGFYGRVDLGDFAPRPVLYAPQPVIITRGPNYIAEPVYLRVPVDHRRHWSRYCGRYGACGRPVLFVRDEWYRNTYVPRWREHYHPRPPVRVIERVEYRDHGPYRGPGPGRHDGWDRGHGPDRGHGRGPDWGHDRGPGRGHDRGPDHGPGRGPDRGPDHGPGRGPDRGHGDGHGHGR
jgi:hypothetical protein